MGVEDEMIDEDDEDEVKRVRNERIIDDSTIGSKSKEHLGKIKLMSRFRPEIVQLPDNGLEEQRYDGSIDRFIVRSGYSSHCCLLQSLYL